jgi:hypothetical protein
MANITLNNKNTQTVEIVGFTDAETDQIIADGNAKCWLRKAGQVVGNIDGLAMTATATAGNYKVKIPHTLNLAPDVYQFCVDVEVAGEHFYREYDAEVVNPKGAN